MEQAEKDRLKAIEDAAAAEKAAADAALAAAQLNESPQLTLQDQTEQQTAEVPPAEQLENQAPLGSTEMSAAAAATAAAQIWPAAAALLSSDCSLPL